MNLHLELLERVNNDELPRSAWDDAVFGGEDEIDYRSLEVVYEWACYALKKEKQITELEARIALLECTSGHPSIPSKTL